MSELLDQLDHLVWECAPSATCVVFDNLSAEATRAVCELAEGILGRGSGVAHVFTLRSTAGVSDCPLGVWQVGARELLLDDDEARDLVRQSLGQSAHPDILGDLVTCSGRQPGLLSLMARCVGSEPENWRTVLSRHDIWDALWRLAASQLDDREQRILQCMALLGAGTVGDLGRVLGGPVSAHAVSPIGAAIPLVSLEGHGSARRFHLHELAQNAFGSPDEFSSAHDGMFGELLAVLASRGDEERLLHLLVSSEDVALLVAWLERVGYRVLRRGSLGVLGEALACLTPVQLVEHPRILVLKAAYGLECGKIDEAYRDSRVARELAEQEEDEDTLANAMLVLAQSTAGLCDFVLARAYLDRAIALCGSAVDGATLTHLYGRRLAMDALFGDTGRYAEGRRNLSARLQGESDRCDSSDSLARYFMAIADIILCGSWADSARWLESCCKSDSLSLSLRVSATYNFFGCMIETGRIVEAEEALSRYVELAGRLGSKELVADSVSMDAGLRCARGAPEGVFDDVKHAADSEWERGERLSATTELMTCSTGLLGNRLASEGLCLAETAGRWADEVSGLLLAWPARLEEAACRLFLGGESEAERVALRAERDLAGTPCRHLILRADLILSEVDLKRGDVECATSRLQKHVDYILTESANWQLAMYVRAFPRLLGPLTLAVGATSLPVHMLNLIPQQYAEDALAAAEGVVSSEELGVLSQRLLGRPIADQGATPEGEDLCTVRLFGGLQVEANGRTIRDREWRKSKARLLFAMLATRCGKDIPREQLIEYLWPEMDADQARNNLYVVWSAMKNALSPGLGRGADCPYVEHRRGTCRTVAGRVLTDVDEFDRQLTLAARARNAKDEAAELTALQLVAEIYRGELLPGEVYDDWFASLRERCRHDFEDAMLRAAALLQARGDAQGGVSLLRRALQHDPWREDLYQAALRLQMVAGQRSAAIETYLSCRSRLVDDLGIDPSAETTRLYEQVLGMEQASGDYSA
jgi:DNA-binding SARP family transcriptional activator